MTRAAPVTAALRVVTAGLTGTIAGIHLDLWESYGYKHIPTIGSLFLLNAIAGAAIAVACLIVPARLLSLPWLTSAGYAAATLAALIVSLNGGLFGFNESTSGPLLTLSIAIEAAAVVLDIAGSLWRVRTRV